MSEANPDTGTNTDSYMKSPVSTLLMLFALLPSWLAAQNHSVQILPEGGVYADTFLVTLSCDNPDLTIRYTLNGNRPTAKSKLYSSPLVLSKRLESRSDIYKIPISPKEEFFLPSSVKKGIAIRAAAFDRDGNRVSPVVTQSYFIGSLGCDLHGLPVVSICADSLSLFAHDTGILVPGKFCDPKDPENTGNYAQHGREWEREVNVEFYAGGNCGFNQMAGLRTHGGIRARRAQQKGLKIYARQEYGENKFRYRIFEESELEKYKHLVLRPFRNAATPSGVNDWLANQIAAPLNMGTTASRPAVLFLNGEYWGIYFIEEKVDERYLESHYVVDCNNVNIVTSWETADCGSADDFLTLTRWLETADLSDTAQYNYLSRKIDIPNILDYYIFELFAANWDWPSNNAKCWQNPGGPWHWVFYDGDCCLDDPEYITYTMACFTGDYWSARPESTLLFRKLLESNAFKNQYLLRLRELNETVFRYRNTKPYLDKVCRLLEDEIPMQVQRFGIPQSVSQWEESCRKLDHFLSVRESLFWRQTEEKFRLRDDNVRSAAFRQHRTIARENLKMTVVAKDECAALMEIIDPKGKTIHQQYLFLHAGENQERINLGRRSGVYVVKVGDAVCEITKTSYWIPVVLISSALVVCVLIVYLIIRRRYVSRQIFR